MTVARDQQRYCPTFLVDWIDRRIVVRPASGEYVVREHTATTKPSEIACLICGTGTRVSLYTARIISRSGGFRPDSIASEESVTRKSGRTSLLFTNGTRMNPCWSLDTAVPTSVGVPCTMKWTMSVLQVA